MYPMASASGSLVVPIVGGENWTLRKQFFNSLRLFLMVKIYAEITLVQKDG